MKSLGEIANRYPQIFKEPLYIDGLKGKIADKCLSILKRTRGRFEIKHVECRNKRQKFLCEDHKDLSTYVKEAVTEPEPETTTTQKPKIPDETLDIKETFFRPLGQFSKNI